MSLCSRVVILTIILAARVSVQSYEDGVIAEHRRRFATVTVARLASGI
jgi:hypothetical protein